MSAIDLSVVQELLDLCDDSDLELFVELIEVFLRDAPVRVNAILAGCETGDLEQVAFAAHALKGSAGNLGAVLVQQVAEELQQAGRAADLTRARRQARPLVAAYRAAAGELKALADRYTAD